MAAQRAAIRLIERQDRTTADLRARLVARGFSIETVEWVIDRLVSKDLLNDRRFAERFAELAASERGMGSRRVRMELVRRGVEPEMATETGLDLAITDHDRAVASARKRAKRLEGLPNEVAYRRLLGFLARKGFPPDVCLDATREALRGLTAEQL
ncbi:MAG: regulatory protein RecX [Actinomycetota bacterium]